MTKKFGWIPDKPDIRDNWYHSFKSVKRRRTDKIVDLRRFCPPIEDQGDLGACTAFAISGILGYNRRQQGIEDFEPSHLFIYFNERKREGTTGVDAGASIRTGIKSVSWEGYCRESLWPYRPHYFNFTPPDQCYKEAKRYKALMYYRLDNKRLDILRSCIDNQECFVFGASIYDSFYDADTNGGFVPMPQPTENNNGGHAMMVCGYDDFKKVFIVRNSWGDKLADKGYYYIPYDYITNEELCDDFWSIITVT
jgi:C1A family cysteine protease